MSHATEPTILLWFRQDLRLEDNPALQAAIETGGRVIPFYILEPQTLDTPAPGGASRWWLHHALADLDAQLRELGLRLTLRMGEPVETIRQLCAETKAQALYANRHYEPQAAARQQQLAATLPQLGIRTSLDHNASLLLEPQSVLNKSGSPFQVFTPYWRTCCDRTFPKPLPTDPTQLKAPLQWPQPLPLEALQLLPALNWDAAFYQHWEPTREGVQKRLSHFISKATDGYEQQRDFPAVDATSQLSPWLHFGQIGPREVVAALQRRKGGVSSDATKFLAEIGWREFSYYLLHHCPQMPTEPLRAQFASFPWQANQRLLRSWQRGATGYPFIDAGMQQLWQSGWMHNRVRMVVASFLVKNLLQPWQEGAAWFLDTLVDADLAANSQGWQWSAGCGVDAAPYFRVFNPVTQGERFDPQGDYVRRWLPQLRNVPAKYIHRPWDAPQELLARCGVTLGQDYPEPIIGLMEGRIRALGAYDRFTAAGKSKG